MDCRREPAPRDSPRRGAGSCHLLPDRFELPLWPFVLTALAAILLATALSLRLNRPPAAHPGAAPRRLAIRLLLLGALLLGAGAWALAPR